MLEMGRQIKMKSGETIKVLEYIAEGGQGEVYKVDCNGKEKALKWYKKSGLGKNPEAFYENIEKNILRGAPSKEFLWPLDITLWTEGTFGYVMDLRPSEYHELSEFMLTTVRFKSFKTAIDAALHIIYAFRLLHNDGYSYQDLNDGNFFLNANNGKVLICDNDNVAPDGKETGIIGKPRYMAPEIVLGEKMPDSLSDRFSMSIIVFIILCMTHPLEGKRSLTIVMPPELQEKLYGSEALFIMDPNDEANRPDKKIHRNICSIWSELPEYMKQMFINAFGQAAIKNPNARPKELDWIKALVRFRSEIVKCSCGDEVFVNNGNNKKCEKCGALTKIYYKLELGEYCIPGIDGSRIYRCQVGSCNAEDALNPVAGIIANKNDTSLMALVNMGDKSWNATTPSGKVKRVQPKEMVPMKDGIKIAMHNEEIIIKK